MFTLVLPDMNNVLLQHLPLPGTAASQFLCAPMLWRRRWSRRLGLPGSFGYSISPGAVILAAGLVTVFKEKILQERGLNRIIALGPVFLAVPFIVFGRNISPTQNS